MTDHTLIPSRRRNGKAASCEPCRKRKTRCDHGRPVCKRCRQRGQQSTCFYHPAPLTRRISSISYGNAIDCDTTTEPEIRTGHSISANHANTSSDILNYRTEHECGVRDIGEASTNRNMESPSQDFMTHYKPNHGERVASIAETISHLRDFGFINDLVCTYYSNSRASVIPSSLILCALSSLSNSIATFNLFRNEIYDNDNILRFGEAVLRSTSTRISTTSLSHSDFMNLYTGENPRLEYLGIVFSVAARSCLIGLAKDGEQHDAFIQDMFSCSTTCLCLAREITPVNDMLVWLGQDYLMLMACMKGDSSKQKMYSGAEHILSYV